jgi:hypothetical protein
VGRLSRPIASRRRLRSHERPDDQHPGATRLDRQSGRTITQLVGAFLRCGHRWCSSQVSMSPSEPVRDNSSTAARPGTTTGTRPRMRDDPAQQIFAALSFGRPPRVRDDMSVDARGTYRVGRPPRVRGRRPAAFSDLRVGRKTPARAGGPRAAAGWRWRGRRGGASQARNGGNRRPIRRLHEPPCGPVIASPACRSLNARLFIRGDPLVESPSREFVCVLICRRQRVLIGSRREQTGSTRSTM